MYVSSFSYCLKQIFNIHFSQTLNSFPPYPVGGFHNNNLALQLRADEKLVLSAS